MKSIYRYLLLFLVLHTGTVFLQNSTATDSSEPKEDNVTRLQSCDAFNSLEDGQPTPPRKLEVRVLPTFAYSKAESQIIGIEPELEFTPKSKSQFL